MTRTITIIYKVSHHYREKIFAILITAILISACAYVFLLQKAIVNVVERQKLSTKTKSLSVQVGDLEEKYFSIKNSITLDLAHSKGLKDAEVISYISKKSLTAMALPNEL
jgi:hypothetical protein